MAGRHQALLATPRAALEEIIAISSEFPHVARNFLVVRPPYESWGEGATQYPTALEAEAHDALDDYVWLLGGAE